MPYTHVLHFSCTYAGYLVPLGIPGAWADAAHSQDTGRHEVLCLQGHALHCERRQAAQGQL